MTKKETEQVYCSVDLEFTGFDPARDQILEIGFAFFKITEKGAEITERWSQVFKPSIEVHPKILGLTGITMEELNSAPEFSEHREFLQDKLGECVIVGHNPIMDVKFLESYGIKLSGKTIDTLELVQFLLPTHHSYNLENLMHYFGIAHDNAHRALGDAVSTVAVLENMLRIFQGFEKDLQTQIFEICKKGTFLWEPLLHCAVPKQDLQSIDSLGHNSYEGLSPLILGDELINIDDKFVDHEPRLALGLQTSNQKTVLVVEDSGTVMRLWKSGLVRGLFSHEDLFSKDAFDAFLSRAQTSEELRFCLKIVVWLKVNWQTDSVNDLNISFFGGQFRQFIIGGDFIESNEQLVCCDYKTFQSYAAEGIFKNREAVVSNLQSFEKFISSGNGTHVSWNSVLYNLRLIYNPETDYGNKVAKDEVMAALSATDLFFALSYMLLHREYTGQQHVALTDIEENQTPLYNKISKAAMNLKQKFDSLLSYPEAKGLSKAVAFLERNLNEQSGSQTDAGRIRWVTLEEYNTSFHDQPLDVSVIAQTIFKQCQSIKFTDTVVDPKLLLYYAERLGLNTVIAENKELSLSLNNLSVITDQDLSADQHLFELLKSSALPAVVVMPNLLSVKNFYNLYYSDLKQTSAVFAQGYSGGGNKMFRNFNIKKNSILLATPEFIAKQKYILSPRTIIFTGTPYIEKSHPYIKALSGHWAEKFPEFDKMLVSGRLIEVMKRLFGSGDPKIVGHGLNF